MSVIATVLGTGAAAARAEAVVVAAAGPQARRLPDRLAGELTC